MRHLHRHQQDFRTANLPSMNVQVPAGFIWGFCLGVFLTLIFTNLDLIQRELISSIFPALMGSFITIAALDYLIRQNDKRQTQRELFHDLKSWDNATVLHTLEALRSLGWLGDGSMRGLMLRGVQMQDAKLHNSDLSAIDLACANLENAHLFRARMRGTKCWAANLNGAMLDYVDGAGAFFSAANMDNCSLRHANFRQADLRRASLRGVNFWQTDLRGANMQNADLSGAQNLDSAIFDETTILPDGNHWTAQVNILAFVDSEITMLDDD